MLEKHSSEWLRVTIAFIAWVGWCTVTSAQVTSTWTNAAGNTWLTAGNWDAGVPASNGIARFFNTIPSGGSNSAAGILMSGATNNGANNQAVGAIFLEAAPGGGTLTVGNSSTTASGTLTLNGATVNSQPNTILALSSTTRPLIISNTAAGGTQSMSLALGNSSNFVVAPAGVSGQQGLSITLNVPVSEVNSGSGITVLGNGSAGVYGGRLVLNNAVASTFTGGMTVGNSDGSSYGTLELKTINALPATTQGVIPTVLVNPNSKLLLTDVNGTYGAGVRVTLNGNGPNLAVGFIGALQTSGAAAYSVGFTAPVTLASDSTIQNGTGGTVGLNGGLTGLGGLTLMGAGTLILGGANDYAGNTVLNSPSKLYIAGVLSPAGSSTVTVNAGATLLSLPGSIVNRPVNSGGTIGQSGQDGGTFLAQVTAGGNIHGGDNGTAFNGGLTISTATIASGVLNLNSHWQINGSASSIVAVGATVNANDNTQVGVTSQAQLTNRGTINIAAGKTMSVQGTSASTKSVLRGTGAVNGSIAFGDADIFGDAMSFTINGNVISTGTTNVLIDSRFGGLTHNGNLTLQPGRILQLTGDIQGAGTYTAEAGSAFTKVRSNTGPAIGFVLNNATFAGQTLGSSYSQNIDGPVTFNSGSLNTLAGIYTFNGLHTYNGAVGLAGSMIYNGNVDVTGTSTINGASSSLTGASSLRIKPGGSLVRTSASTFDLGLEVEGTLKSNQIWNVPVIVRGGTLDSNAGTMTLASTLTIEPGVSNSIIVEGGHVAVTGLARVKPGATLVNRGHMSGTGMLQVDAGSIIVEGGLPSDNSLNEKGIIVEGGLGGHGRVTGSVLVKGFVRPGTSPGILTLSGGFTLEGEFQWELIANSVTNPGTNFDLIRTLTGGTSIAAGATVQVQFGNAIDVTDPFWASDRTWTIIDGDIGAPNIIGIAPSVTGSFSFAFNTEINGPDLLLHWNAAAVPEPTTYVLMGLSLAVTGGWWYRQRCKHRVAWETDVLPPGQ